MQNSDICKTEKEQGKNHHTSKLKQAQRRSSYIELLTEQFQCSSKFTWIESVFHTFLVFLQYQRSDGIGSFKVFIQHSYA